jgi:hypothetical protein
METNAAYQLLLRYCSAGTKSDAHLPAHFYKVKVLIFKRINRYEKIFIPITRFSHFLICTGLDADQYAGLV